MYIKRLELENYRGFQGLTIDFSVEANNLHVFVGINGSGKSSILDAISLALEGFVYTFYSQIGKNLDRWLYNPNHKEKFSDVHPNDIYFDSDHLIVRTSLGNGQQKISWSVIYEQYFQQLSLPWGAEIDIQSSSEFRTSINSQDLSNYFDLVGIGSEQSGLSRPIDIKALPVLAYYRARRTEVYSFDGRRTDPTIYNLQLPYGKYPNSFSISSQDITSLSEWFRSEEDIENAERLTSNIEYRRPNLRVVRSALEIFAKQIGGSFFQEVQALRLQASVWHPRTLLTVQKESARLKIQQLSDGEKMLLVLVLDIARRMAIFNPFANTPEEALQGKGIILIDEIDSHLHPSWQRAVLPALTATFPNCQFIVTTHSPQVISSVPSESIFVLDGGSVTHNLGYTYGRESNSILRELMGVSERIPKIQEKIDECFNLIDDEKFAEAKEKLKSLKDVLGDTDPDIIYLSTTIAMFE